MSPRDGKRYALLHGDQYDQVTTCARWLSVLGDASYNMARRTERSLSWARRKLKLGGHWSLADYAKRKHPGSGQLHFRIRGGDRPPRKGACGRRRDLRPHPHPGDQAVDGVVYA